MSNERIRDEIIPGAESIDLQKESSTGILLLHGFGDTPQTFRLLAGELQKAGYGVRAPLLPGHGRTVAAFTSTGSTEWIGAARDELERFRERYRFVALIGMSMGGALAAIAASDAAYLRCVIFISPYFDLPPLLAVLARAHRLWGALIGPIRSAAGRSILDPVERKKNLGYGFVTAQLLHELYVVARTARSVLPRISSPTLIIQSPGDTRIAPAVARRAYAALRAHPKKLLWVEGSGHILTVDYGRERVFQEVLSWLNTFAPIAKH